MIDEYDIYFSTVMAPPEHLTHHSTPKHHSSGKGGHKVAQWMDLSGTERNRPDHWPLTAPAANHHGFGSNSAPYYGGGWGDVYNNYNDVNAEAQQYIEEKHKTAAAATGGWAWRSEGRNYYKMDDQTVAMDNWSGNSVGGYSGCGGADEDVNDEAEEYIKAKHKKFSR